MTQISIHEPEALVLLGARMLIVARMGAQDGDTVLIRSTMGAEPRMVPLHAHADVETFYVLTGRLDVYLDDATPGWRTIFEGESLTVPGNIKHAVRNSSGAAIDTILATTVRIARFFREIGRPPGASDDAPPTPEDLARIRQKAAEYQYWMAEPGDEAASTR